MKSTKSIPIVASLSAALLATTALADQKSHTDTPPVAGVSTGVVGVTVEEVAVVARGWSAKKHILGKTVYNDHNEKLGKVEDIIISPEKSLSYAILSVGGFIGLDTREVAIPIGQLKIDRDRIVLPGATKDNVRALPEFRYEK